MSNITPPNLSTATSVADADLLLSWQTASVGPLEAITWANVKIQFKTDLASYWLRPTNNLSDVSNPATARTNLGVPVYASGTYSPTISFDTPGDLSVVYTNRTGRYSQVGDMVFVEFSVSFTPTYTTSSGSLEIAPPPALAPVHSDTEAGVIRTLTNGIYTGAPSLRASTSGISVVQTSGGNFTSLGTAAFASGLAYTVGGSIWYRLD